MAENKTVEDLMVELSRTCSEIIDTQAYTANQIGIVKSKLEVVDRVEEISTAIASTTTLGRVKVDGETITADEEGTISVGDGVQSSVVVNTPTVQITKNPASGFTGELSVSSSSLLGQSIVKFYLTIPELSIKNSEYVAENNSATIEYNVPNTVGEGVVLHISVVAEDTVGNKSKSSTVQSNVLVPYIATPSVVAPVANANVVFMGGVTIALSTFSTIGAQDTHTSSSYWITSDAEGENVVASSINNTTDLTSHTFSASDVSSMVVGNTYYAWGQQTGTVLGASQKSASVAFTAVKQMFLFTTSGAGSKINFFSKASTDVTPTTDYTVSINGVETQQTYNSLTFSQGDVVRITTKNGVEIYPQFNAQNKNYLASIDAPFPYMVNSSGQAVTDFNYCFSNCSNLTSIPDGLFDNNTAVTEFAYCFSDCTNLTSIPTGLFDSNTAAKTFAYCFNNCSNLTSIPDGLFDNNTTVANFSRSFAGCTGLTSIPTGLFDDNTNVRNFISSFNGCSNLTSIPTGLFNNNTAAINFNGCFGGCSNLTSIPTGLFNNNTNVTDFAYCFSNCSNLTSIPSGLFNNNTAVTTIKNCFQSCSSLKSIPNGLFDNNTAVTNFSYCFENCSAMTSVLPSLWTRTNVTDYRHCFYGCTKASNYSSVPTGWK